MLGCAFVCAAFAAGLRSQEGPDVELGHRLFLVYCAECHGESGDGWGMRKDTGYARPRSFQSARFKLSTTDNRVPSDDDLAHTIREGMPGSGMPNWKQLRDVEVRSLALWVRELGADALRRDLDGQVAAGRRTRAEADAILAARTEPGPPVVVPPEPAVDPEGLERGRQLYAEACAACHGEQGSPPYGVLHADFDGNRLPATSLRAGQFKGGDAGEQLYVRVLKGMDGTAMPAYEGVYGPDDLWHLVHWVQELGTLGPDQSPAAPPDTASASAIRRETAEQRSTAVPADAADSDEDDAPRGLDRGLTWFAVAAGIALLALLAALAVGSPR